uniref:Uncharacterized protein n=1 Tax=Syphacia muris TaxID=451379 RepID=A0A0N5A9Q1_9BILA
MKQILILFLFFQIVFCTNINLDFLKQKGSKRKQEALFDEVLKVANMISENIPKSAAKNQDAFWSFLDGYRAITKGQVLPRDKKQMKEIVGLGKRLLND